MEDISKINDKLDALKSKYNISQPAKSQNQVFTINQMISLLGSLESKYKLNSDGNLLKSPKTKYTVLQDLVTKLEYELCVKESKNVDAVLNEIIGCLRYETPDSRKFCSDQIIKMLKTNYFNSNIKKKLMAVTELMV
jgi:hypothetical protein